MIAHRYLGCWFACGLQKSHICQFSYKAAPLPLHTKSRVWILNKNRLHKELTRVFFPHFLIKTIMSFTHRGTIREAQFLSSAHIYNNRGHFGPAELSWLDQNEGSS